MPKRSRKYQSALSEADRLTTRFVTKRHEVVEFAVQYDAFIDGKWHEIVRYDNAHGEVHRHIRYPDGSDKRLVTAENNNNAALTAAQRRIKKSFKELRERYIILMRKGG